MTQDCVQRCGVSFRGAAEPQGLKQIIDPKTTVTLGMGEGERRLLGCRERSGEGLPSRAVVFNQGHVHPVVTHPSVTGPRGSTGSSLSSASGLLPALLLDQTQPEAEGGENCRCCRTRLPPGQRRRRPPGTGPLANPGVVWP